MGEKYGEFAGMPPRVRGVIFDMDGLMLDTERLHWEAAIEVGAQLGLPIDARFMTSIQGVNAVGVRRALREVTGSEEGVDVFLERKRMRFRELLEEGDEALVKPGLFEILDKLAWRGVSRAVATGSGRAYCQGLLERFGLIRHFDAIVTGDMVVYAKPDPEIVRVAVRELGLSAEECVVLEDSPNGITAARAAGCRSVMVPDMVEPGVAHGEADAVVESLNAAWSVLEGWLDE